jgi:hypothetical protein
MVEVLHLAAVLPATVGLCCAVGDRRGRARSVAPATAMFLAMLAMAVGWPGLPPLGWAAVLLVLGVAGAVGLRVSAEAPAAAHVRHMRLHRAIGLVVAAGLLLVSSAGHAATSGPGHPGHVVAGSPLVVTMAGAAGYLVFTVWLVARSVRRSAPIVGVVETSAMGLMTALMAVGQLVG